MSPFKRRNLLTHLGMISLVTAGVSFQFKLPVLFVWIAVSNTWLFLVFGSDKFRSSRDMSRTPETTFLSLAILGAFPALLLARSLFKHKTMKKEFIYPMWALFFLQIIAIVYLFSG